MHVRRVLGRMPTTAGNGSLGSGGTGLRCKGWLLDLFPNARLCVVWSGMAGGSGAQDASGAASKSGALEAARTIGIEVDPAIAARLGEETGWRPMTEGLLRLTGLRLAKGADVTLHIRSRSPGPQGEVALVAKGTALSTWPFRLEAEEAARSKREGRFELDQLSNALVQVLTRSFGPQVFVAGLADPDPQVRLVSLWVLALRKDRRATAPLIAMLGDERWAARYGAAEALGKIKDPRAVPPLIALLQREQDRNAKGHVVEALGAIGDPRALEVLLAAVEDPRFDIQQYAVTALGSFRDPRATAALKRMLRSESGAVSGAATKALGAGAVAPVQEGLADKDPAIRARAASLLGYAEDKRAVGALVAALQDPVPAVREGAANALRSIGDPRAVAPLSAHLEDPAPPVREAVRRGVLKLAPAAMAQGSPAERNAVVKTVGGMEGQPADDLLAKALYDTSEEVRLSAVGAMSRRPPTLAALLLTQMAVAEKSQRVGAAAREAAAGPVASLLREGTVTDRRAAARYLALLKDARGLAPLAAAGRDMDPEVRLAVVRALESIGTANAVPPLALMRKDSVVYVRLAVLAALRTIPDPLAVPPLASALDDPMAEVRSRAVEALGERTSDARAVDALFRAVQDPIGVVRVFAALALAAVKDPALVPRLVPLVSSSDERVRAAAAARLRQGPTNEVVPPLCALLAHADAGVRRDVCQLLGEMGDPRAVPPLIERHRDRDPGVKRAATAALGHFPNDPRALEALIALQRGGGMNPRP